jgi:hypothetical protein
MKVLIHSIAIAVPFLATIYLERLRDRLAAVVFPALLILVIVYGYLISPGGGEILRFWLWLASISVSLLLAFMQALQTPDSRRMAKRVTFRTALFCAVIATWWTLFVAWASLSHNPQSVYCDPGPPAEGHNVFFSGSGDCRIILDTWLPFVVANFGIIFLGLGGIISLVVLTLAILSRFHARRAGNAGMCPDSFNDGDSGPTS